MSTTRRLPYALLPVLVAVFLGLPLPGATERVSANHGVRLHHGGDRDRRAGKPCRERLHGRRLAKASERDCPAGGGSSGIARADFNGDGFADLAVGVPGEETPSGQPGAGAVNIIYGSKNGLTTTDPSVPAPQFLSQNSSGVPQFSEAHDGFGTAVVGGDFNGDGFSDLAVGTPSEQFAHKGVAAYGSVTVIFGSRVGLTTDPATRALPAQIFSMNDLGQSCGVVFAAATDDDVPDIDGRFFGTSLAWGDFDGDGIGDLAVGSPDEPLPIGSFGACQPAGAVGILRGSLAGLTAGPDSVFTQNRAGVNDASEAGDNFGSALAAGDFNGDQATDLAIGVLGEDVTGADTQGFATIPDAGAVEVLFGVAGTGLSAAGDMFFDERDLFSLDIAGNQTAQVASAGDQFGSSMAAGDFDGDGRDDLAVGAHNRNSRGLSDSGLVFIRTFDGANRGVQVFDQTTIFGSQLLNFTGSPTESGDHFGFALAAGDFNGDGRKDLAIGVPFEDVLVARGGNTFAQIQDAGEVDVIYGSATGLSTTVQPPQQWHQDTINIDDSVEEGDRFGTSLTAWNFGRNGTRQVCSLFGCLTVPTTTADLAIGIPLEDIGAVANAGAVSVIYSCTSCIANFAGLVSNNDQFWFQGLGGPDWGTPEAGDRFGEAMY